MNEARFVIWLIDETWFAHGWLMSQVNYVEAGVAQPCVRHLKTHTGARHQA